mgnify:CR=1 FL=1
MAKKKETEAVKLHIGTEEEIKSELEIAIKQESLTLAEQAETFKVVDQSSYIKAGEFIAGCQKLRKRIVAYWEPMIDKAMDVKRKAEESRKGIVAAADADLNPIDKAVRLVSDEISRHLKKEAEEERERQRQALIEAGKKDDERRRLEQEEAEKAKNQIGKDEDIWDAIAKDRPKEVKAALEPVYVSKGAVSKVIKTDDLTMKIKPDIEVTLIRKSLLVKSVLAGKIPHEVLVVDLVFAKKWIKENDIKEIDGLKIEEVFKAKVR